MKKPLFRHFYASLTVVGILAGLFLLWFFQDGQGADGRPKFPHAEMVIQRADGKRIPFKVEVASDDSQREYGLMFVRSMPEDAGMIFVWDQDQLIRMWMKNTYIPLDMLFVARDGKVVKILTNAEPFSLQTLSSDQMVRGVIELNGGAVGHFGLADGDKVLFPGFSGN